MVNKEHLIHMTSGGVAGIAGAVITSPLEIIKIRLQSTTGLAGNAAFNEPTKLVHTTVPQTNLSQSSGILKFQCSPTRHLLQSALKGQRLSPAQAQLTEIPFQKTTTNKYQFNLNIMSHLRHIYAQEGWRAMFKGLGPTIAAVAPSKAIYFVTYNGVKRTLTNNNLDPNSAIVHSLAAASGGFANIGVVNPIHVVKTRLQLNNGKLSVLKCIIYTLRKEGILGFYRGSVASCYGVVEHIIHFVIYEKIKFNLGYYLSRFDDLLPLLSTDSQMVHNMVAGGFAKFIACCVAYPHEVVRTRTRESGYISTPFWTHIAAIYREGGGRALYRGIEIQMIRTIPNAAIVMATYEYTVNRLNETIG
uniref:Mitochondrial carrier protein Rim2 n=1 Tax=Rhabditophanes sp. KR3021 TaxID=114890 RepID=A0AC35TGG4_9BILA